MVCVCVDARVAKAAPAGRPVCRAWLDANAFCSPDVLKASGLFLAFFQFLLGQPVSGLCIYNIFIVKLKVKSV